MKDSKEKEHRISNLKNMINNVKEDSEEDNEDSFEDIEEDSELINYLNEDTIDYDNLGIDDEFIYHPDDDVDAVNLEENPINEDYIIKTPKTDDNEDTTNDDEDFDELSMEIDNEISDNFDMVINAKIGGKPILAIVSSIVGIIFIVISIFIFQSRSDRIIDNVVSGESNFLFVIFLVLGLFLLIYRIYKIIGFNNPFHNITEDIQSIELKEDEKIEKPEQKVIEKSKIPLDKESYKIGEFDINEIKSSHKKDDSPKDEVSPITKEIEEIEYEKAKLEGESIDEIFAEIDDEELSDNSKK